jgi:integrase
VQAVDSSLRLFAGYLIDQHPDVGCVADVRRTHLQACKTWLAARPGNRGPTLANQTIRGRLGALVVFFTRLEELDIPDAPPRSPITSRDLPIKDDPLPRFIDDAASAKLLAAVRADPDPFTRTAIELLARTGMRSSELLGLTIDAVVQIGSSFWLRIPVGKLHTDRYVPLHPQLKTLLDQWRTIGHAPGRTRRPWNIPGLAARPPDQSSSSPHPSTSSPIEALRPGRGCQVLNCREQRHVRHPRSSGPGRIPPLAHARRRVQENGDGVAAVDAAERYQRRTVRHRVVRVVHDYRKAFGQQLRNDGEGGCPGGGGALSPARDVHGQAAGRRRLLRRVLRPPSA